MTPSDKYFLFMTDGPGDLNIQCFGTDMQAAVSAYGETERKYPDKEVVLLAAQSLKDLQVTHSHYFSGLG